MTLTYAEFQDRLQRLAPMGRIEPGLERIEAALAHFDRPDRGYRGILIAGTKGKGSTALFTAAYLAGLGYRTGLFTSPHLADIGERILVNGERAPVEFLQEQLDVLEQLWGRGALPRLSFFETMNVLAALYFRKREADFVVWEVGLGGRFDSTNAVKRDANVLTKVSKDHMEWLGPTLSSILSEKVAIYRKGKPFVVSRQVPRVREQVEEQVRKRDLSLFGRDFSWRGRKGAGGEKRWEEFDYCSTSVHPVALRMRGEFQRDNACNALRTVEMLFGRLEPAGIAALRGAYWPGRFDCIREAPPLILDGAHNPDSFRVLCRALKEHYPGRRYRFIIGIQATKDYRGMLHVAERIADSFVFVEVPQAMHPLAPEVLAAEARKPSRVLPLKSALEEAQQPSRGQPTLYCITGSLFLVGAVRRELGIPWEKPFG